MRKITFNISLLATLLFAFTSCKNDLDVLAPGKESVSVYGILNPNETVQNIRINKVYITDGDALVAGQDANQINYEAGELQVTLQRFMTSTSTTPTLTTVGNTTKKEIVLTETVVTTQSGTFSQTQRMWQTTDRLYRTGEYKLIIKNLKTGAEYTAQTPVLDSVKTASAQQTMPFLYIPSNPSAYPMHGNYITGGIPGTNTPQYAYVDYSNTAATQKIKFRSIANAKVYGAVIRFHYLDFTSAIDSTEKYVDITFPTQKISTIAADQEMEIAFSTNSFYTNVAALIAAKNTSGILKRKSHYMEYIIYAGAENIYDFLQVNAPSNSIAQDKASYTNIKVTKDLWNDFIDKIACHPSTNPLLFCNSNGVTTTTCP